MFLEPAKAQSDDEALHQLGAFCPNQEEQAALEEERRQKMYRK